MAALGVRVRSGRRLPTAPALRDVVVLLGVGWARLCGEKAVDKGVRNGRYGRPLWARQLLAVGQQHGELRRLGGVFLGGGDALKGGIGTGGVVTLGHAQASAP